MTRSGFTSARERRWWTLAASTQLLIYASLYWVRPIAEWLRERNLLRLSVAVLFLMVLIGILRWSWRRRPGRSERAAISAAAAAYVVVLWLTPIPEERVHFLQYGVVAALIYAALLERRQQLGEERSTIPFLAALLLTTAGGWVDEGIQAILPNRYYDLRDVGLNAAAALLALLSLAAVRWARERDRQLVGPSPDES